MTQNPADPFPISTITSILPPTPTPTKPDLSCLEFITRILQILIWSACCLWTVWVISIPSRVEANLKSVIPDYQEPMFGSGLSSMGVSQLQIYYLFAGFVLAFSLDKILRTLQIKN